MLKKQFGRIINASSISGKKGAIAQTNYAASKAAINGLTLSLAQELGPRGITVNAVSPGFTLTDMIDHIPEKIKVKAEKRIPLNRMGTPEEIAGAYVFLASKDGSYCNGTILDIDGGLS